MTPPFLCNLAVCLHIGPNAATVQYNGMQYTLFPERVNHTEADAACRRLPDGRLAQLDTQAALDVVGQALLPTLPMQVRARHFSSRWGWLLHLLAELPSCTR